MASLISTNGNALVEVGDVDGVRIAGFLMDAGEKKSENLLKWGTTINFGNKEKPGVLSDVFGRVGGPNDSTKSQVTTQRMIQINSAKVIIDHTWLWRADHDVAG